MAPSPRLDELLQAVETLSKFTFQDAADKRKAMLVTRAVSDKLQHPYDKILEMWGATSKDAAMKVCIDTGLFAKWKAAASGRQTVAQLSTLTDVQHDLLATLLKHLATWHIINEEAPDCYSPTEFSQQLARPEVAACVELQFDAFLPTFPKLPAFLKATNYRRPTDGAFAPLSYAMNFPGTFFEYMQSHPQCGQSLDMTMKGYAEYRGSWLDAYPGENLIREAEPGQVLVVDVGGGLGHDMGKFRSRFPHETKGRLILQDQANVIEKVGSLDGVSLMTHDFLTEQPVKGACAYYLHQILHDWPEEQCRQILACLKPALAANKNSRILVNEMVVPPTGASMNNTAYDLIMMSMFSAAERSEKTWLDLIASTGLNVVKIWTSPIAIESVIEIDMVH